MYFMKIVLISLVLLVDKNSSAQTQDHTTDQNEVENCSSHKKVCGTDGKTYRNICLLQKETGVKLAHEGSCTSRGKKKTPYRPDLILKSKIVNNTEESLQKKLVKHFNPTTGKWEYVVEILPTIVITPKFYHLQMTNDDEEPSSSNETNVKTNADLETVGAINATNGFNVNNLPSTYFHVDGKPSGGIYPKHKIIVSGSQGSLSGDNNIITEIVGDVTNNFPRSQFVNGDFVPIKNETIPTFSTSESHPNRSHPGVFPTRETSNIHGQKSPVHRFQTDLNKRKSFNRVFRPIKSEAIPTFNTSVSHPNQSHPNVFPSQLTNELTGDKSPDHQFQTVVHEPQSLNTKFIARKKLPKRKQFPNLLRNHTNSHKLKPKDHTTQENPGDKKITPLPVDLLPAVSSLNGLNISGPVKAALQRSGNQSNEMQQQKNQTLSEKPVVNNVTNFRKNDSIDKKINEMPITLHENATETPDKIVGNNSSQNPKKTNKKPHAAFAPHALHPNKPLLPAPRLAPFLDSRRHKLGQKQSNKFKPPIGNVSSPSLTTNDNAPELNVFQPTTGNVGQPQDHPPVNNVSQTNKKLIATSPRNDSDGTAMNIFPPLSGNHSIPKVNITKNRTHVPHHFGPHSAVGVSKPKDWVPPFILENPKENITQTKPNIDTKPKSNTKWGIYHIKLPGNVSDDIDLFINWELLQLKTNQPNLTINVNEVIGSKNYTWPEDPKYSIDTSTYHKLMSGNLTPINEKIQRKINDDVRPNINNKDPQFFVNISKTGDAPVNVGKTVETKTYQLEDEAKLKQNVNPPSQVVSKKFGHSLEKHGSYSLDLPSNVAGNFKLIFEWALKNKLPKTIGSPINVTEKQVKYDYKWKIGANNKGEKPIGNEEIQPPIRSVIVTADQSDAPMKHSFGAKKLTGRKSPGRRLHDLAQSLGNVHLDIPKTTTKPQLDTTSASVKTGAIKPADVKLYPGWYYVEMLFNVPGGDGGGCSANNSNCTNRNNYTDDTSKSNGFDKNITIYKSLLPVVVTNVSSQFFQ